MLLPLTSSARERFSRAQSKQIKSAHAVATSALDATRSAALREPQGTTEQQERIEGRK